MPLVTRQSPRSMGRRQFLKFISSFCVLSGMPAFGHSLGNTSPMSAKRDALRLESFSPPFATDHHTSHRVGDMVLKASTLERMNGILKRLSRIQQTVGYGNFCLLGFDDMRHIARSYSRIGEFPASEIACLENLFFTDATRYGFKGHKPFQRLTDRVDKQRSVKIPGSGNYLYKGRALDIYRRVSKDVGSRLVLTAGVRGIVKQFYLFLSKALRHQGNLSLTARSIAPPGYSFHLAGDFDVGQAGFGVANFTRRFTETDVYRKLNTLSYVKFRYPLGNPTGVVFEPWHIQVA